MDSKIRYLGLLCSVILLTGCAQQSSQNSVSTTPATSEPTTSQSSASGTSVTDDTRKADLNNIFVAINSYKNKQGQYPEKSSCIENMSELKAYYQPPNYLNGSADFQIAKCTSGYYYQYLPGKDYLLWAKMENHNLGNTDDTPDVFADKVASNVVFAYGGQGGAYFVTINSLSNSETQTQTQTVLTKGVKRVRTLPSATTDNSNIKSAINNLDTSLNKQTIDPIYDPYRQLVKAEFAKLISVNLSDVQEVNWGSDLLYKTVDASGLMIRGVRLQVIKGPDAIVQFDKTNTYYKTNHNDDVLCGGQLSAKTNCPNGLPVYFKIAELGENAYFGLYQVFLLKGDTYVLLSFQQWESTEFSDLLVIAKDLAIKVYSIM